ncbi:MAG: M28 family peptidase [Nakamurella sp.]
MQQTSRSRLVSGVLLVLALAGVAWFSIVSILPPATVPADAPASDFSVDRAFSHVERIGIAQHPVGSAAANDVRDYIEATLKALGLQPQIQHAVSGTGALSGPYGMAEVDNIVAVLPGTASTGRVFLFAHYDSVQVSFGANDDGAGVSTLLETARALTAGPPPSNDIVFLFTDGEEACLCGAQAFVNQNPLAAGGGVALNFESRGSGGPAVMFETTTGNANVVKQYAEAVPYPVATSLAVEVYRLLPNDTDFSPFRDSGRFSGLNTAYIDGSAVYHAPEDKPEYMDRGSLQQHGDNALALARSFGAADIAALAQPAGYDETYFPAAGTLARYPGWLVWPFAVLGAVGVGALGFLALRRGLLTGRRLAAAIGLALLPLIGSLVAAQLLWTLLVAIRPGFANMTDPWFPTLFRVSVTALVATVLLTWYGLLRRRIGPWALAIGGLSWLAVLGIALAAVAPGGSYLAALPALIGALTGLIAVTATLSWLRLMAIGIGGSVAVVILAPTVYLFFPALGLETGAVAALFAVMLGLALLPAIELSYPPPAADPAAATEDPAGGHSVSGRRGWSAAPALFAGALSILTLGAGLLVNQFDPAHPAPTQLAYAMETDTGEAIWASGDVDPGEWISQYVTGPRTVGDTFGALDPAMHTGPAQQADLPPPELTVDSDRTAGGVRSLTVTVRPQRAVRLVYLQVPNTTVLAATVQGEPVPVESISSRFGVIFHAPPSGGVTFVLQLGTSGPTQLRVMDGSDGLSGLPGFTPRPDGVGIRGSHTSELLLVAKNYTV